MSAVETSWSNQPRRRQRFIASLHLSQKKMLAPGGCQLTHMHCQTYALEAHSGPGCAVFHRTGMSVSGRSLATHAQPMLTWQQAPALVPRAVYGSWVVSAQPLTLPEEACWYRHNRKQILRDLLYTAWGLSVYDWCACAPWAQGMAPEHKRDGT